MIDNVPKEKLTDYQLLDIIDNESYYIKCSIEKGETTYTKLAVTAAVKSGRELLRRYPNCSFDDVAILTKLKN